MIRRFHCGGRKGSLGVISKTVALLITLWTDAPAESSQDPLTAGHLWIGKPAPPIELPSVNGERVSLAGFTKQKFVVLHFAASW